MAATMTSLPPELLTKIFWHAYNSEDERSNVTPWLLVCQKWRDHVLPLLYRDLVLLDIDRMGQFLVAHNDWAVCALTRSLTLRLSQTGEPSSGLQDLLNNRICRLANEVIKYMATLESFSLILQRQGCKVGILRTTISTLLQLLPENCVNLELDTGGKDVDSPWSFENTRRPGGSKVHVCDDLRRLLPRMHHVHIDLATACDAILGTRDSDKAFHPISLPHIRHLLINCTGSGGRRQCGQEMIYQPRPEAAWYTMNRALQDVAGLQETAAGELTVLGSSPPGGQDQSLYWTLLRCHLSGGDDGVTTWAFPVTYLPPMNRDGQPAFYVRTENGAFVATNRECLYDIVGGHPWRLSCTGTRLPVSVAPRTAWVPDEWLGILTEAEWKEKYPRKQTLLWTNERKAGMRLVDYEERKDFETRSAVEMTPEGFVRPWEDFNHARLFTVEEYASWYDDA